MANNLHDLTIGHCNIQGGLTGISKSTEISNLINKHCLDVLSINETNLGEDVDSSTINIPSAFDFVRKDRPGSSRGGCALIINRKLAYKIVEIDVDVENIEAIWLKVKSSNIHICGFYRSSNYCHIDNFIEYMNFCMRKLRGKRIIFIGDINIDQNKVNDSRYKKLDMTLKTYNLVQTVQGITRYNRHGDKFTATTIDVVFTNSYSDFKSCEILNERIGDHQAIKCIIDFSVQKAPKYEKVIIRNHSLNNIRLFRQYISSQTSVLENICNEAEVEIAANKLNSLLNDNYDYFFPLKTISVHEKFIHKPSKELLQAIKVCKKLFIKFRKLLDKTSSLGSKGEPPCNRCRNCSLCRKCDSAWDNYKIQRNLVNKVKKQNKRQNVINDLQSKSKANDLKGIWKTIKLASNMSPTGNPQTVNKTDNLNADKFNEHFTNVGPTLQSKIPMHENVSFADFLPPATDAIMHDFDPVLESSVIEYVNSIDNSKSTFNSIPMKIFKAVLRTISAPLTLSLIHI